MLKILVYHPNIVYVSSPSSLLFLQHHRLCSVSVASAHSAQFLDIQSRPEELISPVLSIIICTLVQLFLVDRALLFTRINQEPLDRTSVKSKVVVWGIGTVLCLGVALSFAGGLGTAIALHVRVSLPEFCENADLLPESRQLVRVLRIKIW